MMIVLCGIRFMLIHDSGAAAIQVFLSIRATTALFTTTGKFFESYYSALLGPLTFRVSVSWTGKKQAQT